MRFIEPWVSSKRSAWCIFVGPCIVPNRPVNPELLGRRFAPSFVVPVTLVLRAPEYLASTMPLLMLFSNGCRPKGGRAVKVLGLVYPGMTLLDLVGPVQAWSF